MYNLFGIIQNAAKYLAKYGVELLLLSCLPVFISDIAAGTSSVALCLAKTTHKASIIEQKVYVEA